MKEQDIVKFKAPADEDEVNATMVVIEMRGDRVVVADTRFEDWTIAPTTVYPLSDLVAV